MKRRNKKARNPILVALQARHAETQTTMRDRRSRRSKDSGRSWRREEW